MHFLEEDVSSDMLRLRRSPAKGQRRMVRKDQFLFFEGVYTVELCVSRFSFEKVKFYVNREDWDRDTPSISSKEPGTKSKFGKDRVHREELSKSVNLMSVVLKFEETSHEETLHQERCARRAAWDLANNTHKRKSADKATFDTPIEARVMQTPTSKGPEEREFAFDSGASMHMLSKKKN